MRTRSAFAALVGALAFAPTSAHANVAPVWNPLTPPYVSGHGFVLVPSQDALYQIGGDVPPDYPAYATESPPKGGLWVWPLDGSRDPFTKGELTVISPTPGVSPGQFFYEPLGNRILRIAPDVRVRAHDVTATTATFTSIVPAGTPPPEEGPAAFDADSSRVLLVTRALSHPEPVRVFALAATPGAEAWSELATTGAPASLSPQARAVYDSIGARLIVIEPGHSGPVVKVFALSLATRAWTELFPSPIASAVPSPARDVAVAFDPIARRAFLYGGRRPNDDVSTSRTWALELADEPLWHDVQSYWGGPPEPRFAAGMVWDGRRGGLWMNGGTTSTLTSPPPMRNGRVSQPWFHPLDVPLGSEGWMRPTPPFLPRTLAGAGVAVDAANGRFFVLGGGTPGGGSTRRASDSLFVVSMDRPHTWTRIVATAPSVERREGALLAYDPVRDDLWTISGAPVFPGDVHVRRLHVDATPVWEEFDPTGVEPSYVGGAMIHDAKRDRLLFVHSTGSLEIALAVTALPLAGPSYAWTSIATQGLSPALARNFTVTHDPLDDRLWIVGGEMRHAFGDPSSTDSVFTLDLASDPPRWGRGPNLPGGVAAGRTRHVAVHYPGPRWLLVTAGNHWTADGSQYDASRMASMETWVLPLDRPSPWIALGALQRPRVRMDAIAVYDTAHHRLLLAGGHSEELPDGETWTEQGWTDDLWELELGGITPARLDLVECVADAGGAAIRVRFAGEGVVGGVHVERSSGEAWEERGVTREISRGVHEFADTDVVRGVAYRYRGRWADEDGGEHETSVSAPVTLPGGDAARLALAPRGGSIVRAWPLVVEVTVAPGPATLELLDVRGRVLARARVGASGAVELPPAQVPAAGLYFVRLVQGAEQVSRRVVRL